LYNKCGNMHGATLKIAKYLLERKTVRKKIYVGDEAHVIPTHVYCTSR